MKYKKNQSAFSLIELSIVLLIIAIVVVGVIGGTKLASMAKLTSARTLTTSSPAAGTEGLVLWLESTSKTSFNASEVNSGVIGTWYDQNPQLTIKNNATSTGASRPVYTSNAINGLPALKFDGIDDYFTILPNGSTDLTAWTIFVVVTIVNKDFNLIIAKGNDTFENFEISGYATGAISPLYRATDGTRPTLLGIAGNAVDGVPNIFTYRFQNNASVGMQFYKNSSLLQQDQSSAFLKTPLTTASDNNLYIGIDFNAVNRYLNGNVGEIIIFNRALSDFEKQEIEKYLSKKWQIKFY